MDKETLDSILNLKIENEKLKTENANLKKKLEIDQQNKDNFIQELSKKLIWQFIMSKPDNFDLMLCIPNGVLLPNDQELIEAIASEIVTKLKKYK